MLPQFKPIIVQYGTDESLLGALSDGLIYSCSVEANDAAIEHTYPMFSRPVVHEDFLQELSAP